MPSSGDPRHQLRECAGPPARPRRAPRACRRAHGSGRGKLRRVPSPRGRPSSRPRRSRRSRAPGRRRCRRARRCAMLPQTAHSRTVAATSASAAASGAITRRALPDHVQHRPACRSRPEAGQPRHQLDQPSISRLASPIGPRCRSSPGQNGSFMSGRKAQRLRSPWPSRLRRRSCARFCASLIAARIRSSTTSRSRGLKDRRVDVERLQLALRRAVALTSPAPLRR